mgnify:CR=1 FL=1
MFAPRYTHGHSETVVGSHRTRTAGNSAAYLLPLLYMVTTSFQQPSQISTPGAPWWPGLQPGPPNWRC